MPRRRGAFSGLVVAILGLVALFAPFIGPYFDLSIGTDETWQWSSDRFWLSVLPGVTAFVAGLLMISSANRASGGLGAWLGLAAGVWLVIGPSMALLWKDETGYGLALGSDPERLAAQLVYFYATGVAIAALSGLAFGRMSVRSAAERDAVARERAEREAAQRDAAERAAAEREGAARERVEQTTTYSGGRPDPTVVTGGPDAVRDRDTR